jgi:hypothetical protein
MNIFALDKDPVVSAYYMCNKHVIKMALESTQLLCSVFDSKYEPPYRRTHYNHPCSIWARTSKQNYEWLIEHGLALTEEYTKYYNKIHKCKEVIEWCKFRYIVLGLPDIGQTPFPLCMPDQYKVPGDSVTSYRNYYKGDKSRFAKWTHGRQQPTWW